MQLTNLRFLSLIMICTSCIFCKPTNSKSITFQQEIQAEKIHGLNFVAPPREFEKNPIHAVKNVEADWIAVIPYGYTMPKQNRVIYNREKWQWWGETPAGVKKTIALAQQQGIKVMLKPQVYFPRSWSGNLSFENESDWQQWESDYTAFIMTFVQIASEMKVEMICIGTEFKQSVIQRPSFWKEMIEKIRKNYPGKLTYASNWDEFDKVTFWDQLDFIGINAYFPLCEEPTPSQSQLKKAWIPPMESIRAIHEKFKKPVIFTEYGYLSVDACASRNWELESKIKQLNINEQAQSIAIESLWKNCSEEKWWLGGFIWKWFPNMQGHEGYPERDYSPQGKLGENTLKECHQKY